MSDTSTASDPQKSATASMADEATERQAAVAAVAGPEGEPAAEGPVNWISRIFSGRRRNSPSLREDLAEAISEDGDENAFSEGEKAMLTNILRLQDVRVGDLMIPRAVIEAVENETTLGELLQVFEQSGHSRMPVYVETLDDPRGMVHIRDVVGHITRTAAMTKAELAAGSRTEGGSLDLRKVELDKPLSQLQLVRKVLFVPPSMPAGELMTRMQSTRTQMALVIDEYGGTEGLVSLEDLVEVIVGDIEDEHDDDSDLPLIEKKGEGVFVVDAKAAIEDVAEMVGSDFDASEHSEDVDTIGGLLVAIAGRVPVRGEIIEGLGVEFRVIDADPRRLKRIEILTGERRRPRKPS